MIEEIVSKIIKDTHAKFPSICYGYYWDSTEKRCVLFCRGKANKWEKIKREIRNFLIYRFGLEITVILVFSEYRLPIIEDLWVFELTGILQKNEEGLSFTPDVMCPN